MKDTNNTLATDNKNKILKTNTEKNINEQQKPSKAQQRLATIAKKLGLCFAIYQR